MIGDDIADRRWLLALNRVHGVGPRTFQRLIKAFGCAQACFAVARDQLEQAGFRTDLYTQLQSVDWPAVDRDCAWLDADSLHHLICLGSSTYPPALAEIAAPPPILFVHGSVTALTRLQLAIVGSRKPTANGSHLAETFAHELAAHGVAITSGLALGVDAAAHRGALAAEGITLAVAGTGLDQTYPARHRDLAFRIVDGGGALISEFPTGTAPAASNFPRRNRIISGLSLGTLVVEAALHSGSLITAKYAVEQSREVFAIPGSVHNPLARGCHALIREGAKLVETVADIFDEIPALTARLPATEPGPCEEPAATDDLDAAHAALLAQVGFDPIAVDTLVDRTGLTAREVSSMLLILELKGYVCSQAGGWYTRQSIG